MIPYEKAKKISVIHPSRSRPYQSKAAFDRFFFHTYYSFKHEFIISLDSDDPQLDEYKNQYYGYQRIIVNDNRSAVDAVNNAVKVSSGDILIVISDDTYCPNHWDKIILEATEGKTEWLLRVNDGIQKRTCTMPIMDMAYFNRFKYVYNPIYSHAWCDTELTEVGYITGRIIVRNDILFEHKHYSKTGELPDELYKRNDLTHDRDRHIFQERQRINFGL